MSQKTLTVEETLMWMNQAKGGSLPNISNQVLKTSTKYIAGLAADLASNNGRLIVESTTKAVGNNNFPKGNSLPPAISYLVTGVRLLLDTTAGVTLLTAVWKSEAPANWKNGELTISQSGAGKLFESPITDVASGKVATSNDDDFRDVIPFTIRGGVAFEFEVALGAGATANQAYRLELRVVEIVAGSAN